MTQRLRLRSGEALSPLTLNPLVYSDKRPYPHSDIKKTRRKIVILVSQIHGDGLGSNKLDSRTEFQKLAFLLWSQPPHKMTANDSSTISFGYLSRNAFLDIALKLFKRITLGSSKRNENSLIILEAMGIWNTLRRLIGPKLRSKRHDRFEMKLAIHIRLGKLLKRASI